MKLSILLSFLLLSLSALAEERYSLEFLKKEFKFEILAVKPFHDLVPVNYDCSVKNVPDCGLSADERSALNGYTSNDFQFINEMLRGQRPINENTQKQINLIKSGLSKLPNYKGLTIRVVLQHHEAFKDHAVGKIISYPAFTSTSVNGAIVQEDNYYHKGRPLSRFYIYSKTCKYIAQFSRFPEEAEVLCPPNSKFRVLERIDHRFLLEQVEPTETAEQK